MVFAIEFGMPRLPPGITEQGARAAFDKHLAAGVAEAAVRLKQRMVKASQAVQSLGTMANSWLIDPPKPGKAGNLHQTVVKASGPGGIEALVWDKGTRRHPRPPTRQGSPLRRWVRVKLGLQGAQARRSAFAIARDIQRRGLPNPKNSGKRRVGIFTRQDQQFRRTELPVILKRRVTDLIRELGRR